MGDDDWRRFAPASISTDRGLIGAGVRCMSQSICQRPTMRFILPSLVLLALTDTIIALPIPLERKSKSLAWKIYIPLIGTVALIGGLAGIVFLGTKATEAYNSIKSVDSADDQAKYEALPAEERNYIRLRMLLAGRTLSPQEMMRLERLELLHGWAPLKVPDKTKMDDREWRTFKMAKDHADMLERERKVAEAQAQNAHFHAGVVMSTHAAKVKELNALTVPVVDSAE